MGYTLFEPDKVIHIINIKRNEFYDKYREFPNYVKIPYGMTILFKNDRRLEIGVRRTTLLGMRIIESVQCQTYDDIEVM